MDRIYVTYKFTGEDPKAIADVIRAEQTIEFPFELAPAWIQQEVVGKVEEISSTDETSHLITISYNPDVTGWRTKPISKRALGKCFTLSRNQNR